MTINGHRGFIEAWRKIAEAGGINSKLAKYAIGVHKREAKKKIKSLKAEK